MFSVDEWKNKLCYFMTMGFSSFFVYVISEMNPGGSIIESHSQLFFSFDTVAQIDLEFAIFLPQFLE